MKKTDRITIRLSEESSASLAALAEKTGIGEAALARIAIEAYLKNPGASPASGPTLAAGGNYRGSIWSGEEMTLPTPIAEDLSTVAERTMLRPGLVAAIALERFFAESTARHGSQLNILVPEIRKKPLILDHGVTQVRRDGKSTFLSTSAADTPPASKTPVMGNLPEAPADSAPPPRAGKGGRPSHKPKPAAKGKPKSDTHKASPTSPPSSAPAKPAKPKAA